MRHDNRIAPAELAPRGQFRLRRFRRPSGHSDGRSEASDDPRGVPRGSQRVVRGVDGRRLDPETGKIYHLTFSPPPEDVVDRLTQRSDDTEEKAKNRLQVHHSNVEAVVGKYEDKLKEIDGNRSKQEVFDDICGVIDEM